MEIMVCRWTPINSISIKKYFKIQRMWLKSEIDIICINLIIYYIKNTILKLN
jgi:hypothetical protein